MIAPIIISVCGTFNGDVEILTNEDIQGNRVHAYTHFDFLLKRNDKRIGIVQFKKGDMSQGKTQCLVGCESLSDVENLDVVYAIATNYLVWVFLKIESEQITEEVLTVQLESNIATKQSLGHIASKIMSILS